VRIGWAFVVAGAICVAFVALWAWKEPWERARERGMPGLQPLPEPERPRPRPEPPPAPDEARTELFRLEEAGWAELAPLYALRNAKLAVLHHEGLVPEDVLVWARIEEAYHAAFFVPRARRFELLRRVDGWADRLRQRADALLEKGFVSETERIRLVRVLDALKEGERWIESPLRGAPVLVEREAPRPLPRDAELSLDQLEAKIRRVRLGHLERSLAELRRRREPDLEIVRLVAETRLRAADSGPMDARKATERLEEHRAALDPRRVADLEALIGLLEWWGSAPRAKLYE